MTNKKSRYQAQYSYYVFKRTYSKLKGCEDLLDLCGYYRINNWNEKLNLLERYEMDELKLLLKYGSMYGYRKTY